MHDGRVLAAGEVEAVRRAVDRAGEVRDEPLEVRTRHLPGRLLLPGLVNAHAHLDLTAVGHRPYRGDFTDWVKQVIAARPREADAVAASVQLGVRRSLEAGVLTVGDIVGGETPEQALRNRTSLTGVSYLELFGITGGSLEFRVPEAGPDDDAEPAMRIGLQPHAPYSAGPQLYAEAARLARHEKLPLSTHLAETQDEARFTADADGPFRRFLVEIGKWSEQHRTLYGHRRSPVAWLHNALAPPTSPEADVARSEILCAHCNYVSDDDIAVLARNRWSVAYCPRASDYFGHRGHRYRAMLEAGVNVCLGTDSAICHGSLSILDEMRYLHQRDGTDPHLLLKMATVNGMKALGLSGGEATFTAGAAAGIIAVRYNDRPPPHSADPLQSLLAGNMPLDIETCHARRRPIPPASPATIAHPARP